MKIYFLLYIANIIPLLKTTLGITAFCILTFVMHGLYDLEVRDKNYLNDEKTEIIAKREIQYTILFLLCISFIIFIPSKDFIYSMINTYIEINNIPVYIPERML